MGLAHAGDIPGNSSSLVLSSLVVPEETDTLGNLTINGPHESWTGAVKLTENGQTVEVTA